MSGTPSLSSSNRFSILPVYNVDGIDESVETVKVILPSEKPVDNPQKNPLKGLGSALTGRDASLLNLSSPL